MMNGKLLKGSVAAVALSAALSMQAQAAVHVADGYRKGGVEVEFELDGMDSSSEYGYLNETVGVLEADTKWEEAIKLSEPRVTLTENGNYTFFVKTGDQVWIENYFLRSIDNDPPKITVSILDSYDGEVSFKVKVADANGVEDKRIIEGEHGEEAYGNAESFSNESLTYPEGIYTLYAMDRAGNLTVKTLELEASTTTTTAPSVNMLDVVYEDVDKATVTLSVSDYKEVRCIEGEKSNSAWNSAKNEDDLVLSNYKPGRYTLLVKDKKGTIWAYPIYIEASHDVDSSITTSEWSTEWEYEDQTFGADMTYYYEMPETTQPPKPTEPDTDPVEPSDPGVPPTEPIRPEETLPPAPTEPPETLPPQTVPPASRPTETVPIRPQPTTEAVGSVTVLPQTGGFDGRAVMAVLTSLGGMSGAGLYFGSKFKRKRKEDKDEDAKTEE